MYPDKPNLRQLRGLLTICTKHGITMPLLETMTIIYEADESPLRIIDIAEQRNVSNANMTGVVDALEKLRLAERTRMVRDRRAYAIHLTQKGRRIMNDIIGALV